MHRDRTAELASQLTWHWEAQLRPRLDGLTDEEYLWEPVPGWSVRPVGTSQYPSRGTGAWRQDWDVPGPDPAPMTSIAWRLGHLVAGVFGERNATYFGGPAVDEDSHPYAGTAVEALAQLDAAYRTWSAGVAALTAADLEAPCREPGFESESMAAIVLHIHREAIHHGAEVALIRDLWANGMR